MPDTFNRKVGFMTFALLQHGLRGLLYQPGQDKLQVPPDAEQTAGVSAGGVAVDLLKIGKDRLLGVFGDRRDMEKLRQEIVVVKAHGNGKANADELKIIPQCMALQHTAIRNIRHLVFVDLVFHSVDGKHGTPFQNVAQHAVGNVGLRVNPSLVEHVSVDIQKVKAHGGI